MYTENQNNMEQYEDDEIVLDLSGLLEDYIQYNFIIFWCF